MEHYSRMRDAARQSFVQRGVSREKDETCNQDPLAEDPQVNREDHSLLLAKGVLGAKESGERKRIMGMIYKLMRDHTGT